MMEVVAAPFSTEGGYSTIWLMVLYCIGVLAKKIQFLESYSNIKLIAIWASCILLTWGIYVFTGFGRLISYVSPTILLSGILMVVLFSRIRVKGSVVKKLSPLAFGIYLFHQNDGIVDHVLADTFSGIAEQPVSLGVISVLLCALAIFLSGLLVEYIRSKLAKLLKIPALSRKIATGIDAILNRLCSLF